MGNRETRTMARRGNGVGKREWTAVSGERFVIEADVPLPPSRASKAHIPLRELKEGESFASPEEMHKKIRSAIRWMRKDRPETRFATRLMPSAADPAKRIVRVWRVK